MLKKSLQLEREDWRRREYRRLILQAAERVIVRKGLSSMTMDDVAREAEFSKATLYQYFKGKNGLVLEILANFWDDIDRGLRGISEGPASASDKLKESIRFYLAYNQEKENVARLMMVDREFRDKMSLLATDPRRLTSEDDLRFLDGLKLRRRAILDSVGRILEQGVAAGEFRELDVTGAVTLLEALIQGFCYLRSWHERPYAVRDAADFIHEFILRGMDNTGNRAKGESR